jgi:DNA-binding NarL/FixJ family response regulator
MCEKVTSILYVEDEPGIRTQLSDILRDYCETLHLAENGEQGLQQFTEYRPPVIVTDIKMPAMNGIDMAHAIKQVDPDVRIIFTTAFSDYAFLQAAIEMQADGYILKPTDLDRLDEKLRRIIHDINNETNLAIAHDTLKRQNHQLESQQLQLQAQNEQLIENEQLSMEKHEEYEMLFDAAPIPYIIIDSDLNVHHWNRLADTLFDLSPMQAIEIRPLTLRAVEMQQLELATHLKALHAGSDPYPITMQLKDDGSQDFLVHITEHPLRKKHYVLAFTPASGRFEKAGPSS